MPRRKLIKNVVPSRWVFLLHFEDGRTEEMTVEAETFSAAIFSLPRFADVGKFKYELIKGKAE